MHPRCSRPVVWMRTAAYVSGCSPTFQVSLLVFFPLSPNMTGSLTSLPTNRHRPYNSLHNDPSICSAHSSLSAWSLNMGPIGCAETSINHVMAHAQIPDFVFRQNGLVHLNRRGRQYSLLLAAKVCASAVVMLDTPCSEVVWRLLATHSIRQFPLHPHPPCVTVCHHVSTEFYCSSVRSAQVHSARPSVHHQVPIATGVR